MMVLKWTVGVTRSTWGATWAGRWYEPHARVTESKTETAEKINSLTNMLLTTVMLVDVVLSLEKVLGLLHGGVQFNPCLSDGQTDSLDWNAALQKPVPHCLNCIRTRCELFGDFCRCPVFPVIWGVWISNIMDVFVDSLNVGLGKTKTKRKDCRAVESMGVRPASGDMITLLVKNPRREEGLSDSAKAEKA
jgi:hypothetical protein